METTKNTMEDPPERLTSKGAFVDVVKDDRACSCWLLCFSVYWSECCWCFFCVVHTHWPSRYSPTSSYFERSSTRVTCNSYSADSFKKHHCKKKSSAKRNSWQTLKFSLSQRTTSSLLSSRRFGVAIGKRTTCFKENVFLCQFHDSCGRKTGSKFLTWTMSTSPVSWQEIQLLGKIESAK